MAEQTLITTCAVAKLAREAQMAIDADDRADRASIDAGDARKRELDLQRMALADALAGIEVRASHLVPTSAVGAMFQLHLISSWADTIYAWVPEHIEQAHRLGEDMKGIVRMLYAVQAYIEELTGESANDAVGESYMSRRLNPHALVEAAIAA